MSNTHRAILFDAGKIKYDIITLPPKKGRLDALQARVGGNIELLVHRMPLALAPFVAYANETGLVDGLPSNLVAWGTLLQLGFRDTSLIPGAFAGNVVLLGKKEKSLTDTDLATVEAAYRAYLKEIGEEEPLEEATAAPPSPLKRTRDEEEGGEEEEPEVKKAKM